jgi:signal transduction histidine kinase
MKDKDVEKLIFGMAHQIRNPCAIILANANVLLKNARSLPERQSLDAIVNGVRYLEARLDEFVEFSKPLNLKVEEFPVAVLFDEIQLIVKDRCRLQKAKISCNLEKGLTLKADRQQLILALLNVVMNAIESKESGGTIQIEARRLGNGALITVSDDGRGIHPRDLPEVFSPFYSTKEASVGIGLAVSKRIVESHGGDIKVESRQGQGTLVTIHLPLDCKLKNNG